MLQQNLMRTLNQMKQIKSGTEVTLILLAQNLTLFMSRWKKMRLFKIFSEEGNGTYLDLSLRLRAPKSDHKNEIKRPQRSHSGGSSEMKIATKPLGQKQVEDDEVIWYSLAK